MDAAGRSVVARALERDQFMAWCAQLPAGCLVAMEACSRAHHWARKLRALGLDAFGRSGTNSDSVSVVPSFTDRMRTSAAMECNLTPWLTSAGSRRLEGTNISHEDAEGMAYVGVRVEPTVRLGRGVEGL